ncbi:MAG TPA: DinB family protein [Chitinophagaceae bacterium]|nr:DinB family protein [Chitinophagaceae bacterium]
MAPDEIIAEIDQSTALLVTHLAKFNDTQFNQRPADDSWSAAEVTEHLLLIETRINNALGRGVPTDRAPDKKIELMREALRDPARKFPAPEFVVPSTAYKVCRKMAELMIMQRGILKEILQTTNLTQTTEFKHPVLGRLTRLEWIYFNIYHTERHCRQLARIAREVVTSA